MLPGNSQAPIHSQVTGEGSGDNNPEPGAGRGWSLKLKRDVQGKIEMSTYGSPIPKILPARVSIRDPEPGHPLPDLDCPMGVIAASPFVALPSSWILRLLKRTPFSFDKLHPAPHSRLTDSHINHTERDLGDYLVPTSLGFVAKAQ
jgi:hypothetical protein